MHRAKLTSRFSDIAGFVKEKVSKYWDATCPGVELKQFLDMDSHEFTDTQDLQGRQPPHRG